MKMQHQAKNNLKQIVGVLIKEGNEFEYSASWLDAFNIPLLHGVIMKAKTCRLIETSYFSTKNNLFCSKRFLFKIPNLFSYCFLSSQMVKLFNKVYYYYLAKKSSLFTTLSELFFPLGLNKKLASLCGKKEFIKYQCARPTEFAYSAIKEILGIFT